jgi:hypothetical protein
MALRESRAAEPHWHASGKLEAVFAKVYGPIVDLAEAHLPGWALFVSPVKRAVIGLDIGSWRTTSGSPASSSSCS